MNQKRNKMSQNELKLYAIIRADLGMTPGKLSAQAGHAFLNAYLEAFEKDPQLAKEYQKDGIGTKICLQAKNLNQLLKIENHLKADDMPASLIIDSGHIMPPHFLGQPIITALGAGPMTTETAKKYFKRLKLV